MPDWKSIVRERIASSRLEGGAELNLTEELAQHLEDRYRELLSGGTSPEEAYQTALSELDDMYSLRTELERNRRMAPGNAVPAGTIPPQSPDPVPRSRGSQRPADAARA